MINQNFVFSDQDCCMKCTRRIFDIDKGDFCPTTQQSVKPYNRACIFFDRILQGFGE